MRPFRGLYTARFVYLTLALAAAEIFGARSSLAVRCERALAALVPVLCLLSPPHSTPLFAFVQMAALSLRRGRTKEYVLVWAHLLLGSSAYFLQVLFIHLQPTCSARINRSKYLKIQK